MIPHYVRLPKIDVYLSFGQVEMVERTSFTGADEAIQRHPKRDEKSTYDKIMIRLTAAVDCEITRSPDRNLSDSSAALVALRLSKASIQT